MVENMELINSKLNENEKILFRALINYYFGYCTKHHGSTANEIVSMGKKIMESIIADDRYLDILYVDIDSIYIKNTKETSKMIEDKLNMFFEFYTKEYYAGLFQQKKRYILFNDDTHIIKGMQERIHYQDKQLSNIAYDLYGGDQPFYKFRNKKFENRQYWHQAKRLQKIERILEV